MKRTDITELFPEATKEQIDKIMGLNGADVNAAKAAFQTASDAEIAAVKADLQKSADENAQLKQQLAEAQKAEEIRGIREKVSGEKKVPIKLLTGETEEACMQQADDILSYAKALGSLTVPDGGEPSTPPAASTRDHFASWAEKMI